MKHKLCKKGSNYELKDGKLNRMKKFCPKCGPGVFLANHQGRVNCGRCGYTEFIKS